MSRIKSTEARQINQERRTVERERVTARNQAREYKSAGRVMAGGQW